MASLSSGDRMDFHDCFQRRKKIHQEGEYDRISELPKELIIQILCLLDMKDAIKTCVLSKSWEHLWTEVDSIVFDYVSNEKSQENLHQFILGVDIALMQCTCPNINKFSLRVEKFPFTVHMHETLDKWFEFVVNKNVKILEFGQVIDYTCPFRFFNNSSFVRLALERACGYHKIDSISWPSLKSLSLKDVNFGEEIKEKILFGCPMLESLVLDKVNGLSNHLGITSLSVKKLKLLNLHHEDFDLDHVNICLRIDIPWVQELEIVGHFVEIQCVLVNVSSLNKVNLIFNYSFIDVDIDEDVVDIVWFNIVDQLLNRVCHADEIVLGSDLVQALSLSKLLDTSHSIFKCKHLTLHSPHTLCVYEIPGIVCLLQRMPDLEILVFEMSTLSTSDTDITHWQDCLPTFFSERFSFKGNDYLRMQTGNFQHLKNVEINYVEHVSHDVYDECFDFEVVAYILRNSPIIEKLVISPSKSGWSKWPTDRASQYFSLMSSESMIGDKAERWELKRKKSIFEFHFRYDNFS